MEIAGSVIELVNKLWTPVGTCWEYHRHMDQYMSNLRRKVNELNSRKEDVASRLSAELFPGKLPRKEVELWLQNVETINGEIEQEVAKRKYLSRACWAKLAFKKIQEVEDLRQMGDFGDSLVIDTPADGRGILPATALVGETAKRKMDEIWTCLMDNEVRKVGIYGMGGVGKTTIMKHINNRLQSGHAKFDNVIWVTVSQPLNLGNLQKDIAAALNLDFAQHDDETRMAVKLFKWLGEKQNWLLMLDDMWEAFNLEDVGIPEPTPDNGCKLVLTTRLLNICQSMGCKDIKMERLTEEEAWNLFVEKVGRQVFITPELEATAKQVADECTCLPLAIITIAGSMKGEDDIFVWENALEELRESTKGFKDMDKVLEQLKFSYAHLKDDKFRQCLIYSALYPEDFLIKRTQLIRHLIGVGIVDKMKNSQAEFKKGYAMLNKLENACLLESSCDKKYVKMHDLIRDMVIQMKSMDNQLLVEAGVRLRELPNENRWMEELESVSLIDNHISEIPSRLSPKCPKLQTMLLAQNKDLVRIPDSFFSCMHVLRLLDLSYTGIKNLPNSISTLENLVALYLKHCKQLQSVPSVAKLGALRELDLRYTGIQHVPEGMESLINLRYLNLYVRDLELPIGILPKLSCLEYFRLWSRSKNLKVKGEELVGLKMIEKIECQFYSLSSFNIFVGSLHGRELRKYFLQLGEEDSQEHSLQKSCNNN
ncbi:hypothetical protein JCGZ_22349 [Jatropha curcas]|uniref:Uncharacterized protein n=1 Tax=Jatropha curcas TaxID=180498 RepID=A0A067L5R4_JATCU|nr:hypothetical protein JCGZ_22349 [Jatropha curcas]